MKNYAFINEDNEVINIAAFDDEATHELIQLICETNNGKEYYDLSIYGTTAIGGEFYNNRLWLPKPHESWIRGEQEWEPPFFPPNDGFEYYWSESILNWVKK